MSVENTLFITDNTIYSDIELPYENIIFDYPEADKPFPFDNCTFPNLRKLIFKTETQDGLYRELFDSCIFKHGINLVFKNPFLFDAPKDMTIRSVRVLKSEVSIRSHSNGSTYSSPTYHIIPKDITINAKYHDNINKLSKIYMQEFCIDNVHINEEFLGVVKEKKTYDVYHKDKFLGKLTIIPEEDNFAKTIINSDTHEIVYIGNVPDYWSANISNGLLKTFTLINKLTISGKVGHKAFANLNINLDELNVYGGLGRKVFKNSDGRIFEATIDSIISSSLSNTYIEFDNLHIKTMPQEYGLLKAKSVTLESEEYTCCVSDTKELRILNLKSTKIDVKHILNLVKVNLIQVDDGKFPVVIVGLTKGLTVGVECPKIVYRMIYDKINTAFSVDMKYITKFIQETYDTEKNIIYEFDGLFLKDNTISNSGRLTAYLSENEMDDSMVCEWIIEKNDSYIKSFITGLLVGAIPTFLLCLRWY